MRINVFGLLCGYNKQVLPSLSLSGSGSLSLSLSLSLSPHYTPHKICSGPTSSSPPPHKLPLGMQHGHDYMNVCTCPMSPVPNPGFPITFARQIQIRNVRTLAVCDQITLPIGEGRSVTSISHCDCRTYYSDEIETPSQICRLSLSPLPFWPFAREAQQEIRGRV